MALKSVLFVPILCLLSSNSVTGILEEFFPENVWRDPILRDYQSCLSALNSDSTARDIDPTAEMSDVKNTAFLEGAADVFRGGLGNRARLWPNGIVPLVIDSDMWRRQKHHLACAILYFEENTCVRFKPRKCPSTTECYADYVYLTKNDERAGCFSEELGRKGGRQVVNLQDGESCWRHGTIVHEFMHALGFFHEQARNDRDTHVKIHWDNIPERFHKQFRKAKEIGIKQQILGQYDYMSVMHYPRFIFDDVTPVMSAKISTQNVEMGNRVAPTKLDTEKIRKLYSCAGESATTVSSTETSSGSCKGGGTEVSMRYMGYQACTEMPPATLCQCDTTHYGWNCDKTLTRPLRSTISKEKTIRLIGVNLESGPPKSAEALMIGESYVYLGYGYGYAETLARFPKNSQNPKRDLEREAIQASAYVDQGIIRSTFYRGVPVGNGQMAFTVVDSLDQYMYGIVAHENNLAEPVLTINPDLKRWDESSGYCCRVLKSSTGKYAMPLPFKVKAYVFDDEGNLDDEIGGRTNCPNSLTQRLEGDMWYGDSVGDLLVFVDYYGSTNRIVIMRLSDGKSMAKFDVHAGLLDRLLFVDRRLNIVTFLKNKTDQTKGKFVIFDKTGRKISQSAEIPKPEQWAVDRFEGKIYALPQSSFKKTDVYRYM